MLNAVKKVRDKPDTLVNQSICRETLRIGDVRELIGTKLRSNPACRGEATAAE